LDTIRPSIVVQENHVNQEANKEIEVHLYTDGGCSGNPGPGGWGFILRHLPSGKEIEQSGAERETTNNQMELEAVIQGLATLKRPCRIELFTDSVYVGKGMTEWMIKWKKNGWKRKEGRKLVPVKNEDRWKRLDEQLARHVSVKYTRVAGHSGHAENDRVDGLAVQAYQKFL
jgi:ribonuclease HI